MNKLFTFSKIIVLSFFVFQGQYQRRKEKKENIIEPFKMNNYSLYNPVNYPMISVILDLTKLTFDDLSLQNYIFNLLNQTFKDLEIIINLYQKDTNDIYQLNKSFSFDPRIYIHLSYKKDKISNFFNITNIVKGKFILLLQHFEKFKNNELFYYFNYTKGKIDNIFDISFKDRKELYLIRTKILRDIIDDGKSFMDYDELFYYIKSIPKPKLSYIPISLSPNDKYAPLAYTSMLSILFSKNYFTFINFYLIIPKNFSEINYLLIDSLFEQFYYFNITYIQMDERYENAFVHKYITNQAYYRFSLGRLLPN